MRLDKYVSSVTNYSRSQVKKIIKAGRISVNGEAIKDPQTSVAINAQVMCDDELLRVAAPRYFMLNKPADCVSATKDKQHLTAIDLLDEDNIDQLHIAGRLDIDTTGLLLITDDGQWSHRITSPVRDCKKTYYVETFSPIEDGLVEAFRSGVKLEGEKRPTRPAELTIIESHIAHLTICEGKYHQVKRMFAAVGNKVDVLHRMRIGGIDLDEELGPGEYRALTAEEVALI